MSEVTFIAAIAAKIKGDGSDAKASRIGRKAVSAVRGQIAGLEAKLVDAQMAVETAKENLENAIYTTSEITDGQRYCQSIANAQQNLQMAENSLKEVEDSISFFKGIGTKVA